ncbi:MAG: purine-binding chemotaxis protein CheW [Desulfobulbaceae bacterium]|nr:purine-binding chemotaxis protein CheW [Desulfobulbaceae bacterium]
MAADTNISVNNQVDDDSQRDKYLTFLVDTEEYGIAINYVTEIISLQQITEIPDLPESIKGVINLRGKIVPVMDMRCRFHLPPREYDSRTCVVVITLNSNTVGLIVDRVSEVHNIPAGQIEPPPRTAKGGSRFIQGVGKVGDHVTILLEVNALLNQEKLEALADKGN